MPKSKKTKQERAVESHIFENKDIKQTTEKRVVSEVKREDLLRNTTEKEVKNPTKSIDTPRKVVEKKSKKINSKDLETVEKIGEGLPRYKRKRIKQNSKNKISKPKKTITKREIYLPPKIILKKEGYELIITEKPQAAAKIATALGTSTKREIRGVPYYEVSRNGNKIIVACAVGHLFTLTQTTSGSEIPTFAIDWVPNFQVKRGDFTRKYYELLLALSKNAGSLTIATDYDIEGEVIGTNIVRLICNQPDANRMKFSTLTTKELNKAYDEKFNSIDWGQATAGEARHFLDWYYGINLSRALMNAIKTTGRFRIMSIGRVQGPALNLIVQKEKEIQKFKPEPYWQVFITLEKPEIELKYVKDIFDKRELDKFKNIEGKTGEARTDKTEQVLPPNPPFNLTTLQTEAYRLYGYSPSRTLQLAQTLYLAGLISYPRTSSQQLPDSIDYKSILDTLKIIFKVSKLIKRNKPIQGEKTDPAHPSIYPTGNQQVLSGDEEKIYDLIVRRFLSLFCEDAIIDKKKITAKIENLDFNTLGAEIRKKAWLEIYPQKIKETQLPDVNGEVKVKSSRTEEKETQPPKRYSQASIVSELEKRNLGTKATRAAILETLYDRGYIKEKSIEATPLGLSLINTLEKYSPIIIDEELTRSLEEDMDHLAESKEKDLKKKEENILNKAKEIIIKITADMKQKENKIGEELLQAQTELREIEQKENTLIQCPKCQKGDLRITYSKKNRKFFVACSAYPDCKNTYSLPPYGTLKKVDKVCEACNFPMLMSLRKGKAPWIFCFNPECPKNKKRVEEYNEKKERENAENI